MKGTNCMETGVPSSDDVPTLGFFSLDSPSSPAFLQLTTLGLPYFHNNKPLH
ncbi:hypothetical protein FQN60_008698 [Etheostoma spectabile]|uniref:Uncharacterized protein n=1 Tax=Etheostoma spectabile TaxID=54343 RepID=A0A5J5CJ46_9PERO|nr:hypothetical protein FQN60_008698 [Etheostoma spectabile]